MIRSTPSRSTRLATWLPLGVVLAAFAATTATITGPAPRPADAPLGEFSAERAMRDVEVIAREPHPVGSPDHPRVLRFVADRLRELGWEPAFQTGERRGLALTNVLARRPGSASTGAVLVASHYDSVPSGPGAADDAAAVAAMLETARALNATGALRNDVVLLFTDGEERGLLGARLFVDEHPWLAEIGVALNFEARGNSGPSIMFETGHGNDALVREFAASTTKPVASSLAYAVYKLLPNDTDMTEFKRGGLTGLNFAFVNGARAYHSAGDTPAKLSRRSLQHHGEHMLAMTRRFGAIDLAPGFARAPDAIYFNVVGDIFALYPGAWVLPLMAAGLAITLLAMVLATSRGAATWRAIAAGARAFAITLLEVPILALLIWVGPWLLVEVGLGTFRRLPGGEGVGAHLQVAGLLTIAIALTCRVVARRMALSRNVEQPDRLPSIALGAIVSWVALLVAVSLALPGASYLAVWPLLSASIGVALGFGSSGGGSSGGGRRRRIIAAVAALPVLILLPQTAFLVFVAMAMTPYLAVFAVAVFGTLGAGLALPALDGAVASARVTRTWMVAGVSLLVTGMTLGIAGT